MLITPESMVKHYFSERVSLLIRNNNLFINMTLSTFTKVRLLIHIIIQES